MKYQSNIKKVIFLIFSFAAFVGCLIVIIGFQKYDFNFSNNQLLTKKFTIEVLDLLPDKSLKTDYSCYGQKIYPTINISGIPAETKSLFLSIDDPDAPNGNYNHFTAWNIPSDINTLDLSNLPEQTIVGINSSRANNYVPPCPPSGKHRYIFTLLALKNKLDQSKTSDSNTIKKLIDNNLPKAEETTTYTKQN